ncbi:MAG: pirin family protein [Planctomycetota bacterium]
MIRVRKSAERGHADHGWLQSKHTFSFAGYRDPEHTGFRSLRVMNEDVVAQGQGFGTHPHANMEIISYVLSGSLQHRDSMGNGEVLRPGEFQRISAGSGISHSEFNPSSDVGVHFYQIWIIPDEKNTEPSYEQKEFSATEKTGRLRLVASRNGDDGSLTIKQDARIYLSILDSNIVSHELSDDRSAWIQVLSGSVVVNEVELDAGDGAAVSDEALLQFRGEPGSEFMLFDLA